jgi:amidase
MKAAGCIVIGKTNVPEFGLGSHTFNDVFGTTLNPFDHTRTAGGSSGGAAVALATHMLPVADGSDYMGSLRNPAAWNNVFGFRPSQGRVPNLPERDAYLAQLGTEGPMARTVLDIALLLGSQAGYDAGSPLSLSGRLDEFATVAGARTALAIDPAGTRVGWLGDLDGHLAVEAGIIDCCTDGLRRLEGLGCIVDTAAFTMSPLRVWDAWLVWRHVLVSASLSPMIADPKRRELMKPEALWEIDNGVKVTGPQISQASVERTLFFGSITAANSVE